MRPAQFGERVMFILKTTRATRWASLLRGDDEWLAIVDADNPSRPADLLSSRSCGL
jgi:hypothetical protein